MSYDISEIIWEKVGVQWKIIYTRKSGTVPVEDRVCAPYMGFTRSPLPRNNCNLPLPYFGGNYPIVLLDNIY